MADASEKGRRYAQIFRKAGTLLGKGEIERAIETLKEGQRLADQLGDSAMSARFAEQIAAAESSK